MTCEQLDALLCDYLDGTLSAELRSVVDRHLATCSDCRELLDEARAGLALLGELPPAAPPPELITRIVLESANHAPRSRWRNWLAQYQERFGSWTGVFTSSQPKLVMGMALTILTVGMVGKVAGLPSRPLKSSDLNPVKIWQTWEDAGHRAYSRSLKYYESLRVVYEVQSRLRDLKEDSDTRSDLRNEPPPAPKRPVTRPVERGTNHE